MMRTHLLRRLGLFAITCTLVSCAMLPIEPARPVVEVGNERLEGTTNDDGIAAFLGIPYAAT